MIMIMIIKNMNKSFKVKKEKVVNSEYMSLRRHFYDNRCYI